MPPLELLRAADVYAPCPASLPAHDLQSVRHFDFLSGKAAVYEAEGPPAGSALRGHGGADYYLIKAFVDAVSSGDPSHILSGPDETLESHLMVFAAEQARHTGGVVDLRGGTAALMSRDFSW